MPRSYTQVNYTDKFHSVSSTFGKEEVGPRISFFHKDYLYAHAGNLMNDTVEFSGMVRLKMLHNDDNQSPIAADDLFNVGDTGAVALKMRANDTDPDADYIYSEFVSAQLGQVTILPNEDFSYIPPLKFTGVDTIKYKACDLGGLCSATATIVINIQEVGTYPILVQDTFTTESGKTVQFDLTTNDDYNSEACNFKILTPPKKASAYMFNDGKIAFSTAASTFGRDSLQYEVCKTYGYCETGWIQFIVTKKPVAPVSNNDNITVTNENSFIEPISNDNDPNGGTLSISVLQGPFHGDATLTQVTDQNFTYTNPSYKAFTKDSIEYELCNNDQLCDVAWVFLTSAYVAIEENSLVELSVYPNPTKDIITVKAEAKIESIECYDIQGQKIKVDKSDSTVNLSLLSDGVYFLKVYFENGASFVRVVKE